MTIRATVIVVTCSVFVSAACDKKPAPGTITVSELGKLKPGPIRGPLSASQIERVKHLQQVFAEVDPTPLQKLLEDFSRDEHPDQEIAIWESMAKAYSGFVNAQKTTAAGRNEAFSLLLLRSASPSETVLREPLKALTPAEAADLLSRYPDAPQPITVQKAAAGGLGKE